MSFLSSKNGFIQSNASYFDSKINAQVIRIQVGEIAITNKEGEAISTILGSCVAACIRDPVLKLGGMNHFMLPGEDLSTPIGEAIRYGTHAMEMLVNGLLKLGAQRNRFEIKLFGGGNVASQSLRIGNKNIEFVRKFVQKEGFNVVGEDLGGDHGRCINYFPVTGKVLRKFLGQREEKEIIQTEKIYEGGLSKKIRQEQKPSYGDIELF